MVITGSIPELQAIAGNYGHYLRLTDSSEELQAIAL